MVFCYNDTTNNKGNIMNKREHKYKALNSYCDLVDSFTSFRNSLSTEHINDSELAWFTKLVTYSEIQIAILQKMAKMIEVLYGSKSSLDEAPVITGDKDTDALLEDERIAQEEKITD
jgi:hypothetical protein